MTSKTVLCAVVFFGSLSFPCAARADGPPAPSAEPTASAVVVVNVDPSATTIDAAKLRAAVGTELRATAVPPEDPRAATARGTLRVSTDAERHKLVVWYSARSEPIQRDVDLPADPDATLHAAVFLAGNLARNEASELAGQLQEPPHAEQAPSLPNALSGTPDLVEADRMRNVLRAYADSERRGRLAIGGTALTLGVAGLATAVGVLAHSGANSVAYSLLGPGLGLAVGGAINLVVPAAFETLADLSRHATVAQISGAWSKAAEREHSSRKLSGGLDLVVGLALATTGAISLANPATFGTTTVGTATVPNTTLGVSLGITLLSVGVLDTILGVNLLATTGPVENALHAYNAASGQDRTQALVTRPRLDVGVVRGGATAGLTGAF